MAALFFVVRRGLSFAGFSSDLHYRRAGRSGALLYAAVLSVSRRPA